MKETVTSNSIFAYLAQHQFIRPLILTFAGMLLLLIRILSIGNVQFIFLAWNIVLAWIPVGVSYMLQRPASIGWKLLWGFTWLIFLPNAAYLLTDLMHLRYDSWMFWYDLVMTLIFAFAGLMISILSIEHVGNMLRRRRISFKIAALILAPTGIFIGRILRWNSWDIFLHPASLFQDLSMILGSPGELYRMMSFILLFSILHGLSYLLIINNSMFLKHSHPFHRLVSGDGSAN